MCTQRMRYKEFANIKWTDKWTVPQPPTTARPAPEFEKFVKECVSKEIVGVKTWAHLKLLSGYVSSLVMSHPEYFISFAIALGRNRTY
jgi:hypothetical protein